MAALDLGLYKPVLEAVHVCLDVLRLKTSAWSICSKRYLHTSRNPSTSYHNTLPTSHQGRANVSLEVDG